MNCKHCDTSNREGAAFCAECGTPLAAVCTACGAELAPAAKFCDACGQQAAAARGTQPAAAPIDQTNATSGPVRKTVTILFCDLVGSTAFGESVDPEAAREAMGRYFEMVQGAVEIHGGALVKFIGDGAMAVFGIPEVAEDDANRAVAAGLTLQERFGAIQDHIAERYGIDVGLRVGINTGEVVIADNDADMVGDPLNTAARLESVCTPGRVLVGEETWRLTRTAVKYEALDEVTVKGKARPIASFEVVDANAADEEVTPFVGREQELQDLIAVFESARADRVAKLVTIIGSPGVGKTRLAQELLRSVDTPMRVFELRFERSGTTTFASVAELLRSATGLAGDADQHEVLTVLAGLFGSAPDGDRVTPILASLLGAAPARSTEETFFGVRRLIELLARDQPMVLVVDDIQWAEPLFLDLIEHLVEWVQNSPVLVVALARPEIREIRPSAAETGRPVARVISLEGLSANETEQLAARLLGGDALPPDLTARLPQSTQGNPLFVRELIRMLVDDGVIHREDSRWVLTIDADAVEVPPTIQSLLAARVERMPAVERRVVELASVMGSEFPRGAIGALDSTVEGAVTSVLEALRRKELVEPTGAYWGDEPVFRFHHMLIRDAVYRRLLKGTRAELHIRAGEWTENTATGPASEFEPTVAFHFEQAYAYLSDLGILDDQTHAVGDRAASLLTTSAERALASDDLASAGALARRALLCLARDDHRRPHLLVLACEALLSAGDVAGGRAALEELDRIEDDPRLAAWAACFHAQLITLSRPSELSFAESSAGSAAQRLAELGDEAGVAKARQIRARALAALGRIGDCEAELDLALNSARAADDRRRITAVLGSAPTAALWGPSPVPRAGGRCLDVIRLLRITTGSPAVEATSVRCQAVLEALRGRFDTARTMLDASRTTATELGLGQSLMETEYYAGLVELYAGRPAAAEPHLRDAFGGLGELGIGADAGQAAAHLARALLLLGRLDEADQLADQADAIAGQNTQALIATRSVQAEVLAAKGRFVDAVALAEEAVALAEGRDIVVDHANAALSLARVRAAAGDQAGAQEAHSQAHQLFDDKGASFAMAADVDVLFNQDPEAEPPQQPAGDEVPSSRVGANPPPSRDELDQPVERSQQFRPTHHDLPETSATEQVRAQAAAIGSADRGAMRSMISLEHTFESKLPGLDVGASHGGDQFIEMLMNLAEDTQEVRPEFLATRGDDLCLLRVSVDQRGFDYEPTLSVHQVDPDGLEIRHVTFSGNDMAGATAELNRLHLASLSGGPAEVWRIHAQSQEVLNTGDGGLIRARFDDLLSDDFVGIDHRGIGWGAQDREAFAERATPSHALPSDFFSWTAQIHRLTAEGLVWEHAATGDGGATRWSRLSLALYRSGKMSRFESFASDQLAAALERFDKLTADLRGSGQHRTAPDPPRSNAASQLSLHLMQLLVTDRADENAPYLSEDFTVHNRRRLFGRGEADTPDDVRSKIPLRTAEYGNLDDVHVLAIRGERHALLHSVWSNPQGFTQEWLTIEIAGPDNKLVRTLIFDPEDLALAAEELDEIYAETLPEAERQVFRLSAATPAGINSRDFDAAASPYSKRFVEIDHRSFAWGQLGYDGNRQRIASAIEANYTCWFSQVDGIAPNASLLRLEATSFESAEARSNWAVSVVEDGKIVRNDSFGGDQYSAARKRFNEVALPGAHLQLTHHGVASAEWNLETFRPSQTNPEETARASWQWLHEVAEATEDVETAANLRLWAEIMRTMTQGTTEQLAPLFADDFRSIDHRSASYPSMNKLEFLKSVSDHREQVPDIVMYPSAVAAASPRALLIISEQRGTPIDGGAELAWTIPVVVQISHGQCTNHDYFEPNDIDAAMERFHEVDRSVTNGPN